jgi:curved DNA-binding protein CbpA
MFIDYYAILNVGFDADPAEIKTAFKNQALKWHPDKNPGVDTTQRMQLINEAYLILKDFEARQRYNIEYLSYKKRQSQSQANQRTHKENKQDERDKTQDNFSQKFEDDSYEIFDEELKKWMSNARNQAVNLAKQTIDDVRGMSKVGGQAIVEAALGGLVKYFVWGIILFLIFKACH